MNQALKTNFRIADEQPVIDRDSDHVSWELGGDLVRDVLAEKLLVDEPLSAALIDQLGELSEPAFDYSDEELQIEPIEPSAGGYTSMWTEFSDSIKHQRRFFDEQSLQTLQDILRGVDQFTSSEGHTALRTITPGEPDATFFRARRVSTESILNICLDPQAQLGPPPPEKATPGRMNPAGISVFYGSFDPVTCICEIRAPVGGTAAVASFTLLRPIRVLDLTIFDESPEYISCFDPGRIEMLNHKMFMADFHQEMRKPIVPEEEAIDYIPTQAVADFLSYRYSPPLDGIIYSSALTSPPGRNIVFFNHAATVKNQLHNKAAAKRKRQVRGFLEDFAYIIEEDTNSRGFARNSPPELATPGSAIDLTRPPSPPPFPPALAYVDGSLGLRRITSIMVDMRPISIIHGPRRYVLHSRAGNALTVGTPRRSGSRKAR